MRVKYHVLLYYTESKTGDGSDVCPTIFCAQPTQPIQNKLYRYDLVNDKLINPKLLFSAPTINVSLISESGDLEIGPENKQYIIIGDFHGHQKNIPGSMEHNFKNSCHFSRWLGGILRLTQEGKSLEAAYWEKNIH